ncbi:hypothetical protein ACFWZ7_25440 [Nocardiopsis alba]|uniref:hypothetical protein n=1 Tax=Nocardiopsis alba TaxID=53437 RepID=UPI0036712DCE
MKKLSELKKKFARFSPARDQARKEKKDAKPYGRFSQARITTKGAGTREDGTPGARAVGHAVWQKVTGRSPKSDSKMTLQERAQALVKKHGSQRAAAKAAGMNNRSFDRAYHGKNVSKKNAGKITEQQRRDSIRKSNAKRIKESMTGKPTNRKTGEQSPEKTFGIYATIVVSQKPEERWLYPGRIAQNAGALDDLEDLVAAGPDALQERVQEIMDQYVECDVLEIQYINW